MVDLEMVVFLAISGSVSKAFKAKLSVLKVRRRENVSKGSHFFLVNESQDSRNDQEVGVQCIPDF
jgi:hypothetical protein